VHQQQREVNDAPFLRYLDDDWLKNMESDDAIFPGVAARAGGNSRSLRLASRNSAVDPAVEGRD